MARIVEFAPGFPATTRRSRRRTGCSRRCSTRNGYATFAVGKWHLTPAPEMAMGAPRNAGRSAAASSATTGSSAARPTSSTRISSTTTTRSSRRRRPRTGYHLTEDMVDQAIGVSSTTCAPPPPTKPFFLYFTPGACHAPHQAPREFIDRYRGRFDQGWDALARRGVRPAGRVGLLPEGTQLERAAARGSRPGTRCRPTSGACTRG